MTLAQEQVRPGVALESVWCVIPVYNNAGTIHDVAERTAREHSQVLVVDDGSTDADLRELLKDLPVTVLRHERNQGKGAALLTAMRFVAEQGGDYIVTLDGDGQHYPEDLPVLFAAMEPDAIVLGYREEVIGEMPASSRFGREFSDLWIQVETGQRVSDTQSGYRAYPIRHVLQLPFATRHYNFEIEVITRAMWAGLTVKRVPVRVWYARRGERISSFRPFMDNLRISLIHTRLVGRRLLPIPHKRLVAPPPRQMTLRRPAELARHLLHENATPLGLAASAWVGIALGTLPMPGLHLLVIVYVTVRLHLNKAMALAIQNLCVPPVVPIFCIAVGYRVRNGHIIDINDPWSIFDNPGRLALEWVIGALIVAPIFATVVAILVYLTAMRVRAKSARRAAEVAQ